MEREHLECCRRAVPGFVVERDALLVGRPFHRAVAARVIDEDLPHRPSRDVEEVDAIGPHDAGLIDQLEPGAVYKFGRLERVPGPFAAHQGSGNAPELIVGRGEQRLLSRRRSGSAVREELRQVGRSRIVCQGAASVTWRVAAVKIGGPAAPRKQPAARCTHKVARGKLTAMSFPEWIVPMAATLTQERFAGPEWLFERKLDGIRLLAYRRNDQVRLYSRNRLPQHLPAIAQALAELPVREIVLDGEVTWDGGAVRYHVFDVMWIDGRDVMSLPLEERRALLTDLPLRLPVQRVPTLEDAEPWERARREGWEGVIAKRRGSKYEQRRSPHWLKMKCEATQELVVGGFTDPQGKRVGLGALLVGYFEGGEFVFAGKVGTGFDTRLLRELRARLDALEIPKSPFTRAKGLPRLRAHWVRPEVVVQVGFIEWTVHAKLRHPRLLGIRTDKDAREVVRETA